jgi:hypothetical protein
MGDWHPKLQHWAGLIASGCADDFKETALLPDFLPDIFCGLLGTIEPARGRAAETLTLERTLSDLVNQTYGLTSAEITLMWQTARPACPSRRPRHHQVTRCFPSPQDWQTAGGALFGADDDFALPPGCPHGHQHGRGLDCSP